MALIESGIREKKLKTGKAVFELRLSKRGSLPYSKSWPTLAEAQKDKRRILTLIDGGENPGNRKNETGLEAVIAEYFLLVPDIPQSKQSTLNRLDATMGHLKMSQLTHVKVAEMISIMLKTKIPPQAAKKKDHYLYNSEERFYAPATVRQFYYVLKKVAEWHGVRYVYDLQKYAFDKHTVPSGWEKPRERRLEAGEEEKLLAAISKSYVNQAEWRCLILWAIESGLRAQELLQTKWQDVNWEQRYIYVRKEIVKTRTDRQVPLSLRAIEILREHEKTKQATTDRIFWQWQNSATAGKAFRVIVKNAGFEERFTLHDLRHEAVSRLFERTTYSLPEIATITGHRDYNTLLKYAHLRPANAAEKMEKRQEGKVEISLAEYEELLASRAQTK
jgi:integrase